MDNELSDHKHKIFAQIAACQLKLDETGDPVWIDRQIALEQVLATIVNNLVLEHGLHRLFDMLKTKVIDDAVKQLVDGGN